MEESANSSYSLGANHSTIADTSRDFGTQTFLGVPVFDTLQGTGDRLPYQASWAQSITWPLRYLVDWQTHHIWRSLIYMIPSMWLCLRTLQSWRVSVSVPSMVSFGFLTNSSFGLYLRQNEWSDHYVQTAGVCSLAMFFMHRWFQDEQLKELPSHQLTSTACIAISLNGVVTGHPGFWPIALVVWLSTGLVLSTTKVFRKRLGCWLSVNRRSVLLVLATTAVSLASVLVDLVSELRGLPFTEGRLGRSQGLFSEFAFSGLYGLSPGGSLPTAVKSVAASLIATTSMPIFIVLDRVLPQSLRASDFRELSRVEFSGALILFVVALVFRSLKDSSLRSLLTRIVLTQVAIWIYVVASATDHLPGVLAASGTWMILAVVLSFNVLLSWLLLGSLSWESRLARTGVLVNLLFVGCWCLFQFGFLSFTSGFQLADRHSRWFQEADQVVQNEWPEASNQSNGRILIASSDSFYDFLPFVAVGKPVLAPSDPKMRASGQLQASFGLNYSINAPSFEAFNSREVDRVLNFLQVRTILVDNFNKSEESGVIKKFGPVLQQQKPVLLARTTYSRYTRKEFSALTIKRTMIRKSNPCPVLQVDCRLLKNGVMTKPSSDPLLSWCDSGCLWKFQNPTLSSDFALVLPITYDQALVVVDESGNHLRTLNLDGFLAAYSDQNHPSGVLSVNLEPDFRTQLRVLASYLNLLMCLALCWMLSSQHK